jgi:hypothetical protein
MSLIGKRLTSEVPINRPDQRHSARSFADRSAIHDACENRLAVPDEQRQRHSAASSRSAYGKIHQPVPQPCRCDRQYVTVTN